MTLPAIEDRPAFHVWLRTELATGTYPRHLASHALMDALGIANHLRITGRYKEASVEYALVAAILDVLEECPE